MNEADAARIKAVEDALSHFDKLPTDREAARDFHADADRFEEAMWDILKEKVRIDNARNGEWATPFLAEYAIYRIQLALRINMGSP